MQAQNPLRVGGVQADSMMVALAICKLRLASVISG